MRESISLYSAQIRENTNQKNSECGHFSHSIIGVNSVKWSNHGVNHFHRKSFISRKIISMVTYMIRASKHEQVSEDHMTLKMIFSKPLWGEPECSVSYNYGSNKYSVSKPIKYSISLEYFILFSHLH